MQIFAVSLAIVTTALHHYVFSFQRFTLAIARRHAQTTRDVGALQILMTPTKMGALGWLSTLSLVASAVALGFTFAWWWGILYVAFDQLVVGGIIPLFRFNMHFGGLARRELSRSMLGPNAPLASRLMIDVVRAEGGRPAEPTAG